MRTRALPITLLAATLSLIPATRAVAATFPVQLPKGTVISGIGAYSQMAVTATHVFVGGGDGDSAIAVMNHAGQRVSTITGVDSPTGLVVSGSTLYALSMDDAAILVYDISSLPARKTNTWSTDPISTPRSLALSGGRLWFTGDGGGTGVLGSMTTSGTDVQSQTPGSYEYWQYGGTCGAIDHSPFAPDRLFIHGRGCGFPGALYLYDTTPAPATTIASYGLGDQWGWYGSQAAGVTPDGSAMLVWLGSVLEARPLDTLGDPVETYDGTDDWLVSSLAVTSASNGLIATDATVNSRAGVMLWEEGTSEPVNAFRFLREDGQVPEKGLAFSPNGQTLFMVSNYNSELFFHVVDPDAVGTALSLSVTPKNVTFGGSVTLTATLEGASAGETVHFADQNGGSPDGSCVTDAGGVCSWTTKPNGNAAYVASFDGTSELAGSATERAVNVTVKAAVTGDMLREYRTSGGVPLYHEDQRVFYASTVKPNRAGKEIRIYLEYDLGRGGWRDGGSQKFKLGSTSKLTVYFGRGFFPRGRFRLMTTYRGDNQVKAGESGWSTFKVTA